MERQEQEAEVAGVMLVRELLGMRNVKLIVAMVAALMFFTITLALDAKPAFASGTVTVSVAGQGSATGPGIDCNQTGGPDCSEPYADERVCETDPESGRTICILEPPYVELTAGADGNGYVYDGWTGCDSVAGRTCGLTVTGDTALTARFRDAQAPSVTGLSPGSGVQRGTITLSAGASDNSGAVNRVEFRVRGALVATDTTAPYSISFNTASIADGDAGLWATAFDAAGNSAPSWPASVTIDNTAPTLSVTSGPDGQTFGAGSTQTWTFSAADATSGLASVQCNVVATGSAPSFAACSGGSGSHAVSNQPDGSYTFTVRARDNGGLETTRSRTFTVDTAPPDTSIGSGPANGSSTTSTSASFGVSSSEAGSTFECKLDGAAFNACTSPKSYSALKNGKHTFSVRAKDQAGNVDATPASRTWTVDTLKPTVIPISPRHASITRDTTPTIKATVRDNLTNLQKANIKLYVNGRLISPTKYTYSAATDVLVYTSPKLTKGKKTVKIVATDAAKNVGVRSWYFTIK